MLRIECLLWSVIDYYLENTLNQQLQQAYPGVKVDFNFEAGPYLSISGPAFIMNERNPGEGVKFVLELAIQDVMYNNGGYVPGGTCLLIDAQILNFYMIGSSCSTPDPTTISQHLSKT